MRKSISMMAWLGGVAAMLVAGTSFAAEGNASAGSKIFKDGLDSKGVTACQTCHGDRGQGNDGMGAPRLAGQGTAYILKQLNDFAKGKRTPGGAGAVMPGFAQNMSDQDKADVAAYVHSLSLADMPAADRTSDLKALAAEGKKVGSTHQGQVIVKFGVKDKISACQSCHSYNGRGAAPMFPSINQQRYTYLVNQLQNWRALGNEADKKNDQYAPRANDPTVNGVGMMRDVAKRLSDDDIYNIAAFLATAPETTIGNHRVPEQD